MITIIHGDDLKLSRNYFLEEKKKTPNPLSLSDENLEISHLVQIFEGGGLFSDGKKVFIENLFSKKRSGKEFTKILKYLKDASISNSIFVWEGKEISRTNFSAFPKAVLKTFNIPKSVFSFLDSLRPDNGRNNINLFHAALESAEAEFIFYMLTRQFRLLLAVSDSSSNKKIDEVQNLATWQKDKLKKQAGFFSLEKLKKAYKNIFEIDFGSKTGKLNLSLVQAIDFFLLDL